MTDITEIGAIKKKKKNQDIKGKTNKQKKTDNKSVNEYITYPPQANIYILMHILGFQSIIFNAIF